MSSAESIRQQIENLQSQLDNMIPQAEEELLEVIGNKCADLGITVPEMVKNLSKRLSGTKKKRARRTFVYPGNPSVTYSGGKMSSALKQIIIDHGVDPDDKDAAQAWRDQNLAEAA